MDISAFPLFPILCLVISSCFLAFITSKIRRSSGRDVLPPGPSRLPIIGNLHQSVGKAPHRFLAELSKTYGPIISVKLGSITTVVAASPDAAREVLQTHDHVLSGRTPSDPARAVGHDDSIVWMPASARWRFLRKISTAQLFLPHRVDASLSLRMKKVKELLNFIKKSCDKGEAVDIGHASFVTSLNIISNSLFSVDLGTYDSKVSHEIQEHVAGIMACIAKPNIASFFPALGFLDLQGIRKQMRGHTDKLFRIFQGIIDARLSNSRERKDVSSADLLDSLLDLAQQNESELSINDIKHLLLDLFGAGIETSSNIVEWAMAELLRNPETMARAQAEIEQVIDENGIIQESDIPNLPYLQAVMKETFRLHPPGPFLVPRRAESDVWIFGFLVPKNAQVLVNVWDIGRDPKVWDNPIKFEPERFLGRAIDMKGKDFELTPFGAGRRICPGMSLGLRTVHLVLASLLNSYDWKLQNGVVPEDLNMDEAFGLTLRKAKPLHAVPWTKKP